MIAARWCVRGIGLVSMIILARLLSPADFGVVALGMVTVGLITVFSYAGQNLAIIRHPNPTREHFDTAWTISVCLGIAVALGLVALAPLAARYFDNPKLVSVIRLLALAPMINGFTNIGAVIGFRKSLMFQKEFQFVVLRKVIGFIATVLMALTFRNYWALVSGIVGGELFGAVSSYFMHPHRPRPCLSKLSEMWSFSAWMQLVAVGNFFRDQTDHIAVGRFAGTLQVGAYNVAADIASSPTVELLFPALSAALPINATLLHDPDELARSYLSMLGMIVIFAVPMSVGVALVAQDMVTLVLGMKWSAAVPFVPWLAIVGGAGCIIQSIIDLVSIAGRARLVAIWSLAFVIALVPAVSIVGSNWGSEGIALVRAIIWILFIPPMFYSLTKIIPIAAGQIIGCFWRPILAALFMAIVVKISGANAITLLPMRLFCNVAAGVVSFVTMLLLLWRLAGRPQSSEQILVKFTCSTAHRAYRGAIQKNSLIWRKITRQIHD